jgi:hypothetical protein
MTRHGSGTVLCDACDGRIRRDEHELRLSDPLTGQRIGTYHAPRCQAAAIKYFQQGVVLSLTYAHPDHCGPDQQFCDGGLGEMESAR